jgi:predicted PurR-regulated permease PerM
MGLGVFALSLLLLYIGQPLLAPFALALLIWFLLDAFAGSVRRRFPGAPRWVPTTAAIVTATTVLVAGANIVAAGIGDMGDIDLLDDKLRDSLNSASAILRLPPAINLGGLVDMLQPQEALGLALAAARSLVGNAVLIGLFVAFLMLDQRYFEPKLRLLAPDRRRRARLRGALKRIAGDVRRYLWIITLISAGVGMGTGLALAAAGLPGAAFWGFTAFALNFIPTVGSILGVVLPSLFTLMHFGGLGPLLWLVPTLTVIQFIAGNVVWPRVMGERLNLSNVAIVMLLITWGLLWGAPGLFLAMPLSVSILLAMAQFPAGRPFAILLSKTGRLRREDRALARTAALAESRDGDPEP